MKHLAEELAKQLIDSDNPEYIEIIVIENSENQDEKKIVIIVAKQIERDYSLSEVRGQADYAIPGPYGLICPICKGTGKI